MSAATLSPGLAEPVADAQRLFRAVLDAAARPGRWNPLGALPPAPLSGELAAVLLALADVDTPVWLSASLRPAGDYLRFHAGCPITEDTGTAVFAAIDVADGLPSFADFAQGTDEFPDRSATLLIQVPAATGGHPVRLRGPGIADVQDFAPAGLPPGFWDELRANQQLFPRGLDVLLLCGGAVAGLPRSVRVEG